jgi:DHA2 family multidrug resistance protein
MTASTLDSAFASLPSAPAMRRPVNKWLVTVSVTFGTLMGAIDASIVNVAIPHMRGAVGATVEEITWVSTGFALATVLVMPLTAFLGRLFGQKRVYLACLVIFVAGSALCGMARSLESLVAFRVVQGFGAGALQPTEQAILRQTFPPKEQGMAMALFGMAVMIGPAIGPTLGGYIVDHYSWPWIFYINVPVGVLALFMVTNFVHEPEDIRAANRAGAAQQRKHMDWAGIGILCIGLSTLQYALEEGNKNDWFDSRLINGCFLVAAFAIALFLVREVTATVPAVDISLFRDAVFMSGTLIGGVMFAMLMAITFLLPLFMQEVLGFTAMQSGLTLLPRTLVMMAVMPIVGRLYNKVSPRLFVALGVVLFAVSALQMSRYTLDTTPSGVVWSLILQGIALSCLWVPLTTVALSTIPRHKLADATGSNSLVRQIGGSVGLAIFATILTRYQSAARVALVAHMNPGRPEVMTRLSSAQQMLGARGGMDPSTAHAAASRLLDFAVQRQASLLGFEKIFLLTGILFLVVLPLLFFLKTPSVTPTTGDPEHKVEVHMEL